MPVLTREEAQRLTEKALSYSKLPDCEISLGGSEDVFIRFANNGITTSGYRIGESVGITATTEDRRSGSASVSEFTDEALRRGVEAAESLARISKPDPEYVTPLGAQKYPALNSFDPATSESRGDSLIPHVQAIVNGAKKSKLVTAGFVQRSATASAVANKKGLFGFHLSTNSNLTNTMRNAGGTSSGWATQVSSSISDLNGEDAARIAIEKCLRGVDKQRIEPGAYTVILEPAAVSDLLTFLGWSFSARQAEQGQSFLSKKGKEGATLVGDKVFPEFITLRSDPFHPKLGAMPWAPSLLPNERISWVKGGVVRNLFYDRFWAEKAGKKPTPWPMNLVLEGQQHSLEELISSVVKGILVTRFWYIRTLQPQTLQLTGLTRDGVFLVEQGKVTTPLMNFRWNESPVRVLQNAKMLGRPVRTQGGEGGSSLAPALVATEFNFSSISDAV
jgi:predicted Zn-dependent protease